MSHCCNPSALEENVGNPDLRIHGAVPLRSTHSLTALLFEYPDFGSAFFAVDHRGDAGVGYERGARQYFAAVFLDQQDGFEGHCSARLAHGSCDDGRAALRDLDLMTAALDDCVHY